MSEQLTFNLVLPEQGLIQLWTPDEIYDRLSSSNVLSCVEDRRVERKGANVQPKLLAEYLSMWSNTQPHGGLIIVGVDDDGGIGGCVRLGTEHKNNIEKLSHLCPTAR